MMHWTTLRSKYKMLRKRWFTKPRPTGPYVTVNFTPERVRRILGMRYYAPNWEFSYNKRGEDLNLARVVYADDYGPDELDWWQVHVRGWANGDTTELTAHYEAEPTEHPAAHLDGTGTRVELGMTHMKNTLATEGVAYTPFTYQ